MRKVVNHQTTHPLTPSSLITSAANLGIPILSRVDCNLDFKESNYVGRQEPPRWDEIVISMLQVGHILDHSRGLYEGLTGNPAKVDIREAVVAATT